LELQGVRIGFFTSVVGMGGSEVLVADAMEAAFGAGADIVCWSEPNAAIRRIVEQRAVRLHVTNLDWPAAEAFAGATEATMSSKRRSACSRLWRTLLPMPVRRWAGFRRAAGRFAAALQEVLPDLLFVNVNGSEAASVAGANCGIPVVNCYHLSLTRSLGGPLARLGDWMARRATMRAGMLTVHTSAAARDQWSRAFRYPITRTRLIYNGVDQTASAARAESRKALGVRESEFVFCVPGRLDPMKGHRYLIDALTAMRDRLANVCVLVCGDGALRGELEQQVGNAGLGAVVRFLGWRSDLPTVLHAADCTVLASVASENLSVAVLESLMAGTPAIVTSVGGMPEAIRDGETGLVVPPVDSDSMARALSKMVAEPTRARQMGETARQDAHKRFTRDRMMNEYTKVFADVLGSRRSSRSTTLPEPTAIGVAC
jgi:glycosyltransferase involved in cell wall biosynthesis